MESPFESAGNNQEQFQNFRALAEAQRESFKDEPPPSEGFRNFLAGVPISFEEENEEVA